MSYCLLPSVKLMRFWLLLSFGLLAAGTGRAQVCPVTPNPSGNCTFDAVDAGTGALVERLCVGRPVRFVVCAGRPAFIYSYQVVAGNGVLPNPCGPGFQPSATAYTPTQAGFMTVTENGQAPPGSTSTIFFRVFEVYDSPAPNFTVVACAPGAVQVMLPSSPYDRYTVQIGSGGARPPAADGIYPVPAGATTVTVTGSYSAYSLCSNSATKPITQLPPPSPLVIQRLTLQGPAAQLDVAPLATGYRYSVERADAANVYQPVPNAVQNGAASFAVPNAPPGRYRLSAADACGYIVTSVAVPTLPLTATAAERRNELSWQFPDNPLSFELTRNGTPLAVPAPAARTYADTAVACGVSYSYRLTARYADGATSVSDLVPVRATATQPPATPRLFATFDIRNRVVLTASVARFPTTGQLTYLREARPLATTAGRTLRDSSLTSFSPGAAPCFQVRFV
ncbi:MAG: hypothetical protein H7Z21_10405, partial [Hymenobacter sp.]|nr:hypothetical protein [Hymenobacter sp.]